MKFAVLDIETFPISDEHVLPKPVVFGIYMPHSDTEYVVTANNTYRIKKPDKNPTYGIGSAIEYLTKLFNDKDIFFIGHSISYDLGCISTWYPETKSLILELYRNERVFDTRILAKLYDIHIGAVGHYDEGKYSLASLERQFNIADREDDKKNPDAWRTRYHELEDTGIQEYPPEAVNYLVDDIRNTWQVYRVLRELQTGIVSEYATPNYIVPMPTEHFQALCCYCLRLVTARGMLIDKDLAVQLEAKYTKELHDPKYEILFVQGLIRRAVPARPHRKGRPKKAKIKWRVPKDAEYDRFIEVMRGYRQALNIDRALFSPGETPVRMRGLGRSKTMISVEFCEFTYSKLIVSEYEDSIGKYRESFNPDVDEARPVKMAKPKPEQVNMSALADLVKSTCDIYDIPVTLTPSGKTSAAASVLDSLKHLSPVLGLYLERKDIATLISREFPLLKESTGIVYFPYNVLVSSGRTSSQSSKLYTSANGQVIDPRVRPCYMARPGYVLCSTDFSAMELVTLAYTVNKFVGTSELKAQLEQGIDPHAYLGAHLAAEFADDFPHGKDIFTAFMEWKKAAIDTHEHKRYKYFRTLAKPTGLGFPGGLGIKTFIQFAHGYGVTITEEQAIKIRNIWYDAYPEMRTYFDKIKTEFATGDVHTETGQALYAYTSPMGMYRHNVTFSECANGFALQTPGAEGAKSALVRVVYGTQRGSGALHGCHVVGFVHDELLVEIPEDSLLLRRVAALEQAMVTGFRSVIPDPVINVQSVLSRRWDKHLEPLFGADGKYRIHENAPAEILA